MIIPTWQQTIRIYKKVSRLQEFYINYSYKCHCDMMQQFVTTGASIRDQKDLFYIVRIDTNKDLVSQTS